MLTMVKHRPRNINAARAGALLYGDWGTSKAYVIGLAFVVAGYASFWPILAVSVLSLFVGISYILICKYYPKGGGVYSSLRSRAHRNKNYEWGAILGAFFLIADYLITAALSALAAFSYFGVSNALLYSAIFTCLIGVGNYIGPRHTGTFALIIAIAAFSVFTGLALLSIPFLKQGWMHLSPLQKDPLTLWTQFCSVIVALSGVETIANMTPLMKLNKGSSLEEPMVTQTSTPAILVVMLEVIIYTTLFALAAIAIPHITVHNQSVSAPGHPNIENDMLSYLSHYFGDRLIGPTFSLIFSGVMSFIVGLILLSAVNTAMNGLVALQYLMASDGEFPQGFKKLNRFGVPLLPLFLATVIPAIIILYVKKLTLLADLYAIGFVGAITVNLGATSTDFKLPLLRWERCFMFLVFLIMAAIEITLFIQKPHARYFVLGIMIIGLVLRWAARYMQEKYLHVPVEEARFQPYFPGAPLCVTQTLGRAVKTAIADSNFSKTPVNIVLIKEHRFLSEQDLRGRAADDLNYGKIVAYIRKEGNPKMIHLTYSITDDFTETAISFAELFDTHRLMIDRPDLISTLRGIRINILRKQLPEEVNIIPVY